MGLFEYRWCRLIKFRKLYFYFVPYMEFSTFPNPMHFFFGIVTSNAPIAIFVSFHGINRDTDSPL